MITTLILFSVSMFIFSLDVIFSMILLLVSVLMIMLILFNFLNLTWISLIYGITMVSGLMVLFAYISSISPNSPSLLSKLSEPLFFFFILSIFLMLMEEDSFFLESKEFYWISSINANTYFMSGIFMFSLLLIAVYLFLQMTYSKGGGFRKKF